MRGRVSTPHSSGKPGGDDRPDQNDLDVQEPKNDPDAQESNRSGRRVADDLRVYRGR